MFVFASGLNFMVSLPRSISVLLPTKGTRIPPCGIIRNGVGRPRVGVDGWLPAGGSGRSEDLPHSVTGTAKVSLVQALRNRNRSRCCRYCGGPPSHSHTGPMFTSNYVLDNWDGIPQHFLILGTRPGNVYTVSQGPLETMVL